MNPNLVKAAAEVIPDPKILVNMVSQRVRQLCLGHRPMVEFIPGLGHADIALSEIAGGKLSFELTLNQSLPHRCSEAGGRVSGDPCGEGEEKSSLTSLGLRRRCDRRSDSHGRIYAKEKLRKRARSRVLVLVDEANVGSSVRTAGRGSIG